LNAPLCRQQSQSTLQCAAWQAVGQTLGNGFCANALRVSGDQLKQPIKLGLGGDAWHGLGFMALEA
jgi:hypothetical protein